MRRVLFSALVLSALTGIGGRAMAQTTDMPGQVVSNTTGDRVKLIGHELPQVGKHVGKPVNVPTTNPLLRPYNPNNPYEALEGTNLNVKSVVAPVNGYMSEAPASKFDQVVSSLKSFVGISTKPMVKNIYTPGIYRRDRQRAEERMWMRD